VAAAAPPPVRSGRGRGVRQSFNARSVALSAAFAVEKRRRRTVVAAGGECGGGDAAVVARASSLALAAGTLGGGPDAGFGGEEGRGAG
jgi:hypothetical protein